MSTDEIKLQIFRQVDAFDSAKLKEFYGLMMNYINSQKVTDQWNGVTENEIQGIELAINQLKEGKGIPHQEVLSKLRNKYTNA